eukprot:m.299592 g.299592  ORF g.299592 m.299592 type:complete len:630 (-) comp15872_c1_seq3:3997-5886(-)
MDPRREHIACLHNATGVNLYTYYAMVNKEFADICTRIRCPEGRLKALCFAPTTLDMITRFAPDCKPTLVDTVVPLQSFEDCMTYENPAVCIFLVPPHPPIISEVCRLIRDDRTLNPDEGREFAVIEIPRKSVVTGKTFDIEGVAGDVKENYYEWQVEGIPIDQDIITMNDKFSFRNYTLLRDTSPAHSMARALRLIQTTFGLFPRVTGIGPEAKRTAKYLLQMTAELEDPPLSTPEIDNVVIFDRQVDCITPMCSQLTYEGLIDEKFGIHQGNMQIPPTFPEESLPDGKKVSRIALTSTSQVFNEARGMHWDQFCPFMDRRIKQFTEDLAVTDKLRAMSTSEMKQLSSRLAVIQAEKKALPFHFEIYRALKRDVTSEDFMQSWRTEHELLGHRPTLSSRVMKAFSSTSSTDTALETIEGCISKKEPLSRVLRLLCLACQTREIKPPLLDQFRRDILQTYGFEHLLTLENLTKAGLLVSKPSTFGALDAALNLNGEVPEGADELQDFHHVFMGYAPLSIRLVDKLANHGPRAIPEAIRDKLPEAFEQSVPLPEGVKPRVFDETASDATGHVPVTLVCFLGGVTQAELAALRFLSKHQARDYVVLTSDIITGTRMLQSLNEFLTIGGTHSS